MTTKKKAKNGGIRDELVKGDRYTCPHCRHEHDMRDWDDDPPHCCARLGLEYAYAEDYHNYRGHG